jgi:hypothetical protein
MISADERWNYLAQLDEDLLQGGVIESEKSAFLNHRLFTKIEVGGSGAA